MEHWDIINNILLIFLDILIVLLWLKPILVCLRALHAFTAAYNIITSVVCYTYINVINTLKRHTITTADHVFCKSWRLTANK